ncbi:glycosyltransferase N-terminal domain-containing protein [Terriglobus sp. YAF25]|uniref:glycosyltransferase N-terminal domain-containing protein n=1 Tax=Terriglobus sp. YAF25 TaxID=3233080 RepID=UPI003F98A919
MMTLYRLAYVAALLLSAPYWLVRMLMQRKYALSLRQRLGAVPEHLRHTAKRGNIVWLHAVSVGETLAATRLVEELERALPGYTVVIGGGRQYAGVGPIVPADTAGPQAVAVDDRQRWPAAGAE